MQQKLFDPVGVEYVLSHYRGLRPRLFMFCPVGTNEDCEEMRPVEFHANNPLDK